MGNAFHYSGQSRKVLRIGFVLAGSIGETLGYVHGAGAFTPMPWLAVGAVLVFAGSCAINTWLFDRFLLSLFERIVDVVRVMR